MKQFGEFLKKLPVNLESLHLDLGNNNLGANVMNIKYLGDGIKFLG